MFHNHISDDDSVVCIFIIYCYIGLSAVLTGLFLSQYIETQVFRKSTLLYITCLFGFFVFAASLTFIPYSINVLSINPDKYNKCVCIRSVFQENYERMQALVDELKGRTEKIKLGKCECIMDYIL